MIFLYILVGFALTLYAALWWYTKRMWDMTRNIPEAESVPWRPMIAHAMSKDKSSSMSELPSKSLMHQYIDISFYRIVQSG